MTAIVTTDTKKKKKKQATHLLHIEFSVAKNIPPDPDVVAPFGGMCSDLPLFLPHRRCHHHSFPAAPAAMCAKQTPRAAAAVRQFGERYGKYQMLRGG